MTAASYDFPTDQDWLLECMSQLDLKVDPEGSCLGIEAIAMCAFFSSEIEDLKDQFEIIHTLYEKHGKKFGARVKQAEAKKEMFFEEAKKEVVAKLIKSDSTSLDDYLKNLSPSERKKCMNTIYKRREAKINQLSEEEQLIIKSEIYNLLVNLNFIQEPSEFEEVIGRPTVYALEQTIPMVESKAMKTAGGLVRVALSPDNFAISGLYDETEIKTFLNEIAKTFKSCKVPFALVYHDSNHAVIQCFKDHSGLTLDANRMLFEFHHLHQETQKLAEELHTSFSTKKEIIGFWTSLYCFENDVAKIKKYIAILQQRKDWLKLHEVTLNKVTMNDVKDFDWLGIACSSGDINVVNQILSQENKGLRFTPDYHLGTGMTPLMIAIMYGRVNVVEALLNHKNSANPNMRRKDGKETPLTFAIKLENKAIVKALLKHGANVHECDNDKDPPLTIAILNQSFEIATLLLEYGANPNMRHEMDGSFPLLSAIQEGNKKIVALLLEQGAKVEMEFETDSVKLRKIGDQFQCQQAVAKFLAHRGFSNKERFSITALDYARLLGNVEITKLLEDHLKNNARFAMRK